MIFFFNFLDFICFCIGILDFLFIYFFNEIKIILIKIVKCCWNMICIVFFNDIIML